MKILILILFLSSLIAMASEKSIVLLDVSNDRTSNDLVIDTYHTQVYSNRRNILWTFNNATESANDIGALVWKTSGRFVDEEINSTKAQMHLGKKWNKSHHSFANIGGHKLVYDEINSSMGACKIGHTFLINKFSGFIHIDRDFMFAEQSIPAPLEEGLKRTMINSNLQYKPIDHVRIPLLVKKKNIDDGNQSLEKDISILYGRSWPVWWWIGYAYNELTNSEVADGAYWAPEKFTAYGPRFEISYPFTDYLQLSMGYNYSKIKEDDFDYGTSHYTSLSLQYGSREDLLIALNWYENVSEQESNEWKGEGSRLSLSYSF